MWTQSRCLAAISQAGLRHSKATTLSHPAKMIVDDVSGLTVTLFQSPNNDILGVL